MGTPSHADPHVPRPGTALGLFVAILLLQILVSLLFRSTHFWASVLTGQLGAILLPTFALIWWRGYDRQRCIPFTCRSGMAWQQRCGTALLIICSAIVVVQLTELGIRWTKSIIQTTPLFEEQYAAWLHPTSVAHAGALLGALALLPAFTEELLFRGLLQGSFAHAYGARIGLLLSSALFAVAHGNLSFFHLYFGLGCYLGLLRLKSGALWWPILAHVTNNAWTLVSRHF